MKKNFILFMALVAIFTITSCSNDYEKDNTEARAAELRSKIYATAEEYGVKNFILDENKLQSHLDITDGEIDTLFKQLASFPGTYMGTIGSKGECHLHKLRTKATRYSGVYPENWSGDLEGGFNDGDWYISFNLSYFYADDQKSYVNCNNIKCEHVSSDGDYTSYEGSVSNEGSMFTGSIAFDYQATITVDGNFITKQWTIQCSYDDDSTDNELIITVF